MRAAQSVETFNANMDARRQAYRRLVVTAKAFTHLTETGCSDTTKQRMGERLQQAAIAYADANRKVLR